MAIDRRYHDITYDATDIQWGPHREHSTRHHTCGRAHEIFWEVRRTFSSRRFHASATASCDCNNLKD
jgi:hypothetical protein